jgi:hypothetical protein
VIYRRNADEGARRRARAWAAESTQETTDRVVLDKLRAGRAGEITLYELQTASLDLIPREVAQRALQDAVDKLWAGSRHVSLDVAGAGVALFESEEPVPTLVVDLCTQDIDPGYVWQGDHELPRIRVYVNESGIEVGPDGEWGDL